MSEFYRVERKIGEKVLSIETGKLARQADGATVVQYGDTIVLVAAVSAPPRSEDIDFFPLSVDYREKTSAAGKFPGGFIKREGRPSTKETLTARKIDRPIRPLFPEGYCQEVQIIANVLSADQQNDPDILAMIGASASLAISKIPFLGPIGACRLGRIDGKFVINPTHEQLTESDLSLTICGRKEAINMIEVGSRQLPEHIIADAVAVGHKTVIEVCQMIEELAEKIAVPKECPLIEIPNELYSEINSQIADKLYEFKQINEKQGRNNAVKKLFDELAEQYCPVDKPVDESQCTFPILKRILQKIEKETVRKLILQGKRPDKRSNKDVRPISCSVGILPRTHGSALFTRGQTQALVTATLGTIRDAQLIEGLIEGYDQKFMLHYNFPPFSVGEVRPVRGPGRREIGHGALAERALEQVRPKTEEFPYTVRLVADILESNGSSSMATVCSGSLALMDAGIPINKPVAGISIGMVRDGDKCELLMDITGEEDHFGEMDFKIAGTTDGITAIQLDVKAEGLPHDIMVKALELAKQGRLHILEVMAKTLDQVRPNISEYAPKMTTIEIDPELIGKVIGPGGKMVKSIQEQTGATVEIEEDGTIYISCLGGDGHLKAKEIIENLTQPPKVGKIYPNSKVVSVKDFGVFVEITPGVEGLCHISELSQGYVKNIEEICKMGDIIPVKLLSIDDQGRLRLSRKAALAETESVEQTAGLDREQAHTEK